MNVAAIQNATRTFVRHCTRVPADLPVKCTAMRPTYPAFGRPATAAGSGFH